MPGVDESVWLINIFVELLNEGVCVGIEMLEFWYDSVNGKEVELEASVGVGIELLNNSGSVMSVLFIVAVVLEIWLVLALNEFDVKGKLIDDVSGYDILELDEIGIDVNEEVDPNDIVAVAVGKTVSLEASDVDSDWLFAELLNCGVTLVVWEIFDEALVSLVESVFETVVGVIGEINTVVSVCEVALVIDVIWIVEVVLVTDSIVEFSEKDGVGWVKEVGKLELDDVNGSIVVFWNPEDAEEAETVAVWFCTDVVDSGVKSVELEANEEFEGKVEVAGNVKVELSVEEVVSDICVNEVTLVADVWDDTFVESVFELEVGNVGDINPVVSVCEVAFVIDVIWTVEVVEFRSG